MSARTRRLIFALATVAAFLALWLAIAAHPWTGPATRPVDPRLTALAARERRLQHEAGQVQRLLGFETPYEVDGFLKAHGLPVQDSLEEVQRDSERVLALGRR